ncbi:MAG: hypothetical protein M3Q42_10995 [Pseudomonadota bacterium]|nr:hypothetical protein [Pseudomonadota bacterium]
MTVLFVTGEYPKGFVMRIVRSTLLAVMMTTACVSAEASELVLKADVVGSNGENFLEFKLKNAGIGRVCFPRAYLPWSTIYASTVTAVVAGASQRILERNWIIDDPPFGEVCIDPRQELVGQLQLDEMFRDIDSEREKHRVVIFWYHSNVRSGLDAGGHIVLDQQ